MRFTSCRVRRVAALALVLWTVSVARASATWTVVQTSSNANQFSNNPTCVFSATVTSGNLVIVWMAGQNSNETITSATDDKSNTYTVPAAAKAGDGTGTSGNAISLAYLGNITNAPKTITITPGSAPTSHATTICAEIHDSTGALANPLDVTPTAADFSTNTPHPQAGSQTTVTNGDLVLGGIGLGQGLSSATLSAGTNAAFSLFAGSPITGGAAAGVELLNSQTTAGAVNADFNISSVGAPNAVNAIAFKPAGGGGGSAGCKNGLLLMGAGCE